MWDRDLDSLALRNKHQCLIIGQVIPKKEKLREVLNGDRLTNTVYELRFREDEVEQVLCNKTLKIDDITKFRDAVMNDFYFQMSWLISDVLFSRDFSIDIASIHGNQTNQREATPSCNIKTFKASGAKEFFGTEGAVVLLTWFESTESVLHITKCPAKSQVEFTASMLQGRALTW
ncbi:reverse transcriptase domain-containing protein [Tanacetum coccineum]|uniref:Transmembrane 9 superfamily member n=1 Tax=Tanacetum coccineum TaxID=301880 RepID=A0ABQ5ATV1_9ASTR